MRLPPSLPLSRPTSFFFYGFLLHIFAIASFKRRESLVMRLPPSLPLPPSLSLSSHIVEVEVLGPGHDGNHFTVHTVRTNPASSGVVTGKLTYASFLSSMLGKGLVQQCNSLGDGIEQRSRVGDGASVRFRAGCVVI